MRYWLVRAGTTSVDIGSEGQSLTIWSRRSPRLAVGDAVVFLEGSEARVFRRTAKVTRVIPFEGQSSAEKRMTKVELELTDDLPAGLELEVMQYSLTVVRNTRSPYAHFRRGYRLLPKADFETLKSAEAFVARTGYFELLNALPRTLRATFEAEEILSGRGDIRTTPYRARLERLHSFLDHRIFAAGQLLAKLDAAANELALTDPEGVSLGHVFTDDEERTTGRTASADELAAQVQRFTGLRRELAQPLADEGMVTDRDVVLKILEDLDQPERRVAEARFERLFVSAQ